MCEPVFGKSTVGELCAYQYGTIDECCIVQSAGTNPDGFQGCASAADCDTEGFDLLVAYDCVDSACFFYTSDVVCSLLFNFCGLPETLETCNYIASTAYSPSQAPIPDFFPAVAPSAASVTGAAPALAPGTAPTATPTAIPTAAPTASPTAMPVPTSNPTSSPTPTTGATTAAPVAVSRPTSAPTTTTATPTATPVPTASPAPTPSPPPSGGGALHAHALVQDSGVITCERLIPSSYAVWAQDGSKTASYG